MENTRVITIFKTGVLGILLASPLFIFAYEPTTTHKALSQEIIKVFNVYYPKLSLSSAEIELIERGSVDEDSGIRALHHFYDPVYNRGLGNVQISAKDWANDTLAQASFFRPLAGAITGIFGAPSDYSWERAIYDYVWNDKSRGLEALGHILHLIEDASVPDHTRNDAHPPYSDKLFHQASPYEHWADKWNTATIAAAEEILKRRELPANCGSLSSCFDSIAMYSNNNFFSKDTIFTKEYTEPNIFTEITEQLSNGRSYAFGYRKNYTGDIYRLVRLEKRFGSRDPIYSIDDFDKKILTDYWTRLSKQAVLHGAGVVRLFLEEAEKERQSRELFAKSRNLMDRMVGNVLNSFGLGLNDPPPKIAEIPKSAFEPVLPPAHPVIEVELQSSATPSVAQAVPENSQAELQNNTDLQPLPVRQAGPTLDNQPSTLNSLIPIPQAGMGGGAAPAEEESPAPADTTGPLVSLSVSECAASLSSDGCLTATTTLNISWSSNDSDLDYYVVECEVGVAACSNFNFSNTTATSTTYVVPSDDSIYTFKVKAVDKTGNQGSEVTKTAEISTRPVIINEIAWAGTAASSFDEWIELYNRTSKSVSLSSWVLYADDGVPYLNLSGTISAGGYYLIERSEDDNTVSDITADLAIPFSGTGSGSGLSNSGEVLILSKASTTIDQTPSCGTAWCSAGSATGFLTMERINPDAAGTSSSNWGSHNETVRNGKDAANAALAGTARARNSLNYLITTGSTLSANMTLKKSKSPYIIKDGITVNSGVTLTIEPGVVIKFFTTTSSLTAAGSIKANGTSADKIVFTSFKDDAYGGDLNGDGSTASPLAGDWSRIELSGSGSEFDQTVVRYGGKITSGNTSGRSNLKVVSTSASIKNSTIEEAGIYGMWLDGASGTIEGNTIRNNDNDSLAAGIYLTGGSPAITSNTFDANKVGLKIESGNTSAVNSNTFTSHQNEAASANGSCPSFSGNSASSNGINGIILSGSILSDCTLAANLTYVVESTYTVGTGKNLTINSGVIVKFQNSNAAIQVQGRILAEGTSASQIVFTSLKDDAHGGDTNNDSSASSPAAGDWLSITINSSAASSTFANSLLRYGAVCALCGGFPSGAIKIENGTLEVSNSTIESSKSIGLWLTGNSTTTVTSTTFRSNDTGIKKDSPAVFINGGGIIFEGNTASTSPADLIP